MTTMLVRRVVRLWQSWRTWRVERALATRPVAGERSAEEWQADLRAQGGDDSRTIVMLDTQGHGLKKYG